MSYSPNRQHWITTRSGGRFYYVDPKPYEVRGIDIASGLSKECRFNGQTKKFYSVAEHSYRASLLVEPEHALQALLHDGSEAYMKDIPTPLKSLVDEYRDIETVVQQCIYRRFRLPLEHSPEVKQVDARLCASEARLLFDTLDPGWEPWLTGHKPVEDMTFDSIGWHPDKAERLFLSRLRYLWSQHSKTMPSESYKPISFWQVGAGHIHWHSKL